MCVEIGDHAAAGLDVLSEFDRVHPVDHQTFGLAGEVGDPAPHEIQNIALDRELLIERPNSCSCAIVDMGDDPRLCVEPAIIGWILAVEEVRREMGVASVVHAGLG